MRCFVSTCSTDFHRKKHPEGEQEQECFSKHRFPEDLKRRAAWLDSIAFADSKVYDFRDINFNSVRVCSKHFLDSDFHYKNGKKLLNNTATPVVFESSSSLTRAGSSRSVRLKNQKKMDFNGCRLCLDRFAESFTTIDSPELKDQMGKVFWFSIKPKLGYNSSVCRNCSYAISEFYQFAEEVRQNQKFMNENVANCDPTVDSTITPDSIKVETFHDCGLPETTKNACEPADRISQQKEVSFINSEITLESFKLEPLSDSELAADVYELIDEVSDEVVPTFDSKFTLDSVKVEMLSDSELAETKEYACEWKDEMPREQEVVNPGDSESYQPLPKIQTKKRNVDDLEADEPKRNSIQAIESRKRRNEEDQLFNNHFRMICDLCGMPAATFTTLCIHYRKEHNHKDGYVVCCDKKLFKRDAMKDHIDYHTNPDVFRCEVCGNNYENKDILKRHMFYAHSKDPFKCDHCPESFPLKSVLAQHMKKQHAKVKCPECNKMLASKNSLNYHMDMQHSGKDRTMVCDECGETFLSKANFKRHMDAHMGIEVQRFRCEICQRWLKSKQNLRHHMQVVHTDGSQEFQCNICLRKYPHIRALQCHKLQAHAEPKHECEFCGKKFAKANALKEHLATHTG